MKYLILLTVLCSCIEKSPSHLKVQDPIYFMLNDQEFCYRGHVYLYGNAPAFGIDDRPIKCEDLK